MSKYIHTVRKPFYCREGQFRDGKRDLVVGISEEPLLQLKIEGTDNYCFKIGKSNTLWKGTINSILEVGQAWINKDNKKVLITPLYLFEEVTK